MQGATAPFISPWPTKLLMFGEDMQSDQLHVPASQFISLEWQAAKPRTAKSMVFDFLLLYGFRTLSSWERYGFIEREGSASNSLHLALAMAMAAFTVFQVLSATCSCQV